LLANKYVYGCRWNSFSSLQ